MDAALPPTARLLQKAAAEVAKMQEGMGVDACVVGPTAVLAECVQREPVGWRSRRTAAERGRGSCGCRYTARMIYTIGLLDEDPWSNPEMIGEVAAVHNVLFPAEGRLGYHRSLGAMLVGYGLTPSYSFTPELREVQDELRITGRVNTEGMEISSQIQPGISLVQLVYGPHSGDDIRGQPFHSFVVYADGSDRALVVTSWYSGDGTAAIPMRSILTPLPLLQNLLDDPGAPEHARYYRELFGVEQEEGVGQGVGQLQAVVLPEAYGRVAMAAWEQGERERAARARSASKMRRERKHTRREKKGGGSEGKEGEGVNSAASGAEAAAKLIPASFFQ